MKTNTELAKQVSDEGYAPVLLHPEVRRLCELARADEREAAYKRRGVLMFNPYSGTPRHPSDIQSDPHAILLLDPDQALRALKPTGGIEP